MDGRMRRGRKRKKGTHSGERSAKEASRPGKKTGTGLGRVGVGVGPLFQSAVLQEAGLCSLVVILERVPADGEDEITIAFRRAVRKSCQSAGDALVFPRIRRTSKANPLELVGMDWKSGEW